MDTTAHFFVLTESQVLDEMVCLVVFWRAGLLLSRHIRVERR